MVLPHSPRASLAPRPPPRAPPPRPPHPSLASLATAPPRCWSLASPSLSAPTLSPRRPPSSLARRCRPPSSLTSAPALSPHRPSSSLAQCRRPPSSPCPTQPTLLYPAPDTASLLLPLQFPPRTHQSVCVPSMVSYMSTGPVLSPSSGLRLLASPFGDTTYTKVFVGGLAWETTSNRLWRFYERFGDILEAIVIIDRHFGRSKGYGFVTFRNPESVRKACEDPTPVIDGRRANCNLASLGRAQPPVPLGRPRSAGSYFGVPVPRGIYVGGYGQQRSLPLGYYQGFPVPQYSY